MIRATLLCLALLGQAHASCIPANLGGTGSKLIYSENGRGCWVGWWCPSEDGKTKWHPQPYIAVAIGHRCSAAATRASVANWAETRSVAGLRFGPDVHMDPAMLAIWWHERSKLEAVR